VAGDEAAAAAAGTVIAVKDDDDNEAPAAPVVVLVAEVGDSITHCGWASPPATVGDALEVRGSVLPGFSKRRQASRKACGSRAASGAA